MGLPHKLGPYGSSVLGVAGVGFTPPHLPLFLAPPGPSHPARGVLAVVKWAAVAAARLIREPREPARDAEATADAPAESVWKDRVFLTFLVAMILFHAANAPGGVYLGLFLKRDLHAPERVLAYAFAVSMVAWMLVVWPAGRLADRWGRKPLLIAGWAIMTARLALVATLRTPGLVVANQ